MAQLSMKNDQKIWQVEVDELEVRDEKSQVNSNSDSS